MGSCYSIEEAGFSASWGASMGNVFVFVGMQCQECLPQDLPDGHIMLQSLHTVLVLESSDDVMVIWYISCHFLDGLSRYKQ